jgi:hypothetical protein
MRADYLILCDPWANKYPIAEWLAQRLIQEGWQEDGVFGTMRLFRKGDMPLEPLPPAAGFVLGVCHAMHVPCPALEGGADAVMRFCDHFAGGTIATAAWGNFIAARSDPESGLAEIYRAPFASIPAFFAHRDNLFVVSSHIATLRALTGRAGIDMDRVAELLIADGLPSARTAIQGISELLSGRPCILNAMALPSSIAGMRRPLPSRMKRSRMSRTRQSVCGAI